MTRRGANATKFADLQVLEPDGLTRAQYDTVRGLAPPPPTRGTREHYTPPPVAPDWRQLGACRGEDVNLFYPHKGQNAAAAKAICAGCEVRDECLAWAMAHSGTAKWGVWGGKSEAQRQSLRRARRAA